MSTGPTVIAALNDGGTPNVLLVTIVLLMVLLLLVALMAIAFFRPWLQALTSGCSVTVMQLLGMKMRRVDVQQVIRCAVLAKQAGYDVAWKDLESAYLQRVDLEKVTLAYVESRKNDKDWKFSDLVDAERRMRLEEMLAGR